jgi:CubicO group peptidase (beta-lactamase class C family)
MGYALPAENLRMGPNANTLWWAGAGGSVVVIDMDARLCMAYVMNRMRNAIVGDERSGRLVSAVYDSLGPRAA